MESIRKLSNFVFSGQKLVPEYFKPYRIFLHFSRAIKFNKFNI